MSRLGLYLQTRGLITHDQLDDALSHQAVHGARLGTNLVELGYISVEQLAACLADFHKAPLPDRRWLEKPQRAATQRATRSLVQRIRFIPMRLEGNVMHAALLDPRHPNVLDDLRFATGCRIEPYVLPEIWMHDWLLQLFKLPRGIRHVETRGTLDAPRQEARPASRTSQAARPTPPRVRRLQSRTQSMTHPPPRFDSYRAPPPVFNTPSFNPGALDAPFLETTAASQANSTTPTRPSRPISGLPPIPSKPPTVRPASTPPPFTSQTASNGISVRPPPVPVRMVTGAPLASIGETSWSWRPPQHAPVNLERDDEPELEHVADITSSDEPGPEPTPSQPPTVSQSLVLEHSRASSLVGLWRESTPAQPALAEAAEQPDGDGSELEPTLSPDASLPPGGLTQLAPATAAQALAIDLAAWDAELLRVPDRDHLIEVAFRIASCFAPNVALFIVHQGMIQGQRSMENGIARALDGVLIPLHAESAITQAANGGAPLRANPSAHVVDQRVSLILRDEAREVALFPIAIKQRVVNVLYASTGGGPLGTIAYGALAALAQHMGAAYEQLILSRKASASAG